MPSAYGAKENGICHHQATPSREGLDPPPQAARPAPPPQAARPAGSSPRATIVVDVANVMGSRPDGWWRDRPGAAVRLHAELAALAARGRPVLPDDTEPEEFIMVLEGATRAAAPRIKAAQNKAAQNKAGAGVRVVQADGSGDDAIVALVRELSGRRVVVTADRELRRRCEAAGAEVFGPSWLIGLAREH
ncbi:MAG: hypothetical protein WAL72_12570 [Streptosporangiaceae bacterium]